MTIDRTTLQPDERHYPASLLSDTSSQPSLDCIGNPGLLNEPAIALFCSRQCPGELVNRTYELAQRLRDAGQSVIGGFHSPMEQECLRLLLRGAQPIIVCPARSIKNYRVPAEWQPSLGSGRLLVISQFGPEDRRVTAELAERRNHFVAALAAEVFIAHAAPESSTMRFAQHLAARGKALITHADTRNAALLELGARALAEKDFPARTDLGQMPLFDRS